MKKIIFGHSAAGKSILLKQLNISRDKFDFDRYVQVNSIASPNLGDVENFLSQEDGEFYVLPNNIDLLRGILKIKRRYKKYSFIYVERSPAEIENNLKKLNADGLRHPELIDFNEYYYSMRKIYMKLADKVAKANQVDFSDGFFLNQFLLQFDLK